MLTAPDLVGRWKAIVNDNVMVGRDAHLLKLQLLTTTPVQVLLGFYQYRGVPTVSIPQFLKSSDLWLEEDEAWAEVELARYISNSVPADYWLYFDCVNEENAYAVQLAEDSRKKCLEWAGRILE